MNTLRDNQLDLTTVDASSAPIDKIDVSQPKLFETQKHWRFFQRLRDERPVHYCEHSFYGPYWSITKYNDIVAVDGNHKQFSSEPTMSLGDDLPEGFQSFINMDPPKHDVQRKIVSPGVSPQRIQELEPLIRERTIDVLENLPIGEEFDWVDHVSIELTSRMLATLLDFPYEERQNLVRWSDIGSSSTIFGGHLDANELLAELLPCLEAFNAIWQERSSAEPKSDLISLMAHNPATQNMQPMEYLGNLMLLIIGGNDTTRNSMSGSVYALNKFPAQYKKLRANHDLIPNMVSEIIRWQTPLGHMRRTANEDVEIGGETIRKGDKVVMWYVSGNRDESVIPNANEILVDRPNARQHLSFGFGIHRCLGNRLAELQLKILWEEILKRFQNIEVLDEPGRPCSNMFMGYTNLPVKVHAFS